MISPQARLRNGLKRVSIKAGANVNLPSAPPPFPPSTHTHTYTPSRDTQWPTATSATTSLHVFSLFISSFSPPPPPAALPPSEMHTLLSSSVTTFHSSEAPN